MEEKENAFPGSLHKELLAQIDQDFEKHKAWLLEGNQQLEIPGCFLTPCGEQKNLDTDVPDEEFFKIFPPSD